MQDRTSTRDIPALAPSSAGRPGRANDDCLTPMSNTRARRPRSYKAAFGAPKRKRVGERAGKTAHARNDTNGLLALADEYEPMDFRSPNRIDGSPVLIHLM
jgi:hypothetical protein